MPEQHVDLFEQERRYLEEVQAFLRKRQNFLEKENLRLTDEEVIIKAEAWEEHLELSEGDTNGQIDSALVQDELARSTAQRHDNLLELTRIPQLLRQPFFGAVRFRYTEDAADEAELYHIGFHDIFDVDAMRNYVIDWRAPLASVYYNSGERGNVSFRNAERLIHGELLGKFQSVIRDGRLLRVFSTQGEVYDEILQLVLSGMSSGKMREIAQTLQHEQDLIVRSELNRTLIIQGVAGSGKTSVALHRAAYLLYAYPTMKADNILLITPSKSFAAYVSDVLPNLGEENVRQMTVQRVLLDELAEIQGRFASFSPEEAAANTLAEWGRFSLITAVEEFVDFLSKSLFAAESIEHKAFKIPQAALQRLYQENYGHLPLFRRKTAIVRHLLELANTGEGTKLEAFLYEKLQTMFLIGTLTEVYDVFARWLKSEKGMVLPPGHEDRYNTAELGLLTLLKIKLWGPSENGWVRQLLIDEMQDLTMVEHECLRLIFQCPRVILGDIHQAVRYPLDTDYPECLTELYRRDKYKVERFSLLNSYRSTAEITAFSRAVLNDSSIRPLERHGDDVSVQRLISQDDPVMARTDEAKAFWMALFSKWRAAGYCQTAILLSDEAKAQALLSRLSDWADSDRWPVLSPSLKLANGTLNTVVCTVAQAKGVEFDAVMVPDASAENYHSALDQTKLYVACTRALHSLRIVFTGDPSPFLPVS